MLARELAVIIGYEAVVITVIRPWTVAFFSFSMKRYLHLHWCSEFLFISGAVLCFVIVQFIVISLLFWGTEKAKESTFGLWCFIAVGCLGQCAVMRYYRPVEFKASSGSALVVRQGCELSGLNDEPPQIGKSMRQRTELGNVLVDAH